MIKPTPKQIAWFIPPAYLFHLADEYFTGFQHWFSGIFKVDLSPNDFIIINSIGFSATVIAAVLFSTNKLNHFVIAVIATLLFINGVVHIAASVFTVRYVPGTLSAILFYFPLGYLTYKVIFPLLSPLQRKLSVAVGLFAQIVVAAIAMTI